jgi:hypothetical protein
MAETEAKKAEKEATVEKLSTQIDSMNARSLGGLLKDFSEIYETY